MLKLNNILEKYNLKPIKYTYKNNIIIIKTSEDIYVLKDNNNYKTYQYLKSRGFINYLEPINNDDNYEITKYINSIDLPNEQKILDIIELTSILHKKTLHYKEINEDDIKKIYEDINNNITYLYSYYNDIMSIIESKVFMSPNEYLLARNISKVYQALNFCQNEINNWYQKVKNIKKQRQVVLHNNLSLDHILYSNIPYLISWNKSKIDSPIYDLYRLYKTHSVEYDFTELLKKYETIFPLLEEERILFFILIALPDVVELNKSNITSCLNINKFVIELDKTKNLISPYYSKDTPNNK